MSLQKCTTTLTVATDTFLTLQSVQQSLANEQCKLPGNVSYIIHRNLESLRRPYQEHLKLRFKVSNQWIQKDEKGQLKFETVGEGQDQRTIPVYIDEPEVEQKCAQALMKVAHTRLTVGLYMPRDVEQKIESISVVGSETVFNHLWACFDQIMLMAGMITESDLSDFQIESEEQPAEKKKRSPKTKK